MKLIFNDYGFIWGDCLVERTASSERKPKFQVIRVFAPNGEIVEITMTPKKLLTTVFPKEKVLASSTKRKK